MNTPLLKNESTALAEPLAAFLSGLTRTNRELVHATVEALVEAEAKGHACVSLPGRADQEALLASGVAGTPGAALPLIVDGERVYLRRMFLNECAVAAALQARMSAASERVDAESVRSFLGACGMVTGSHSVPLPAESAHEASKPGKARQARSEDEQQFEFFGFAPAENTIANPAVPPSIDWQAVAVIAGLVRPLVVISGGPGTGKTRTASVLLAAIRRFKPGARVALAAPTGKAAARLAESITRTWTSLRLEAGDPPAAATLHRLLGASADGKRFRHGPNNPLPADVVVVDEASMVDLALMRRFVAALQPDARLVLLGDKDQLASVEAGFVLGDLCEAAGLNNFSDAFAETVAAVTGIRPPSGAHGRDTAVELRRNHRFGDGNAIQILSGLVRRGDVAGAMEALAGLGDADAVRWERGGPLIPSFSPNGGEGARRSDEGAVTSKRNDASMTAAALEELLGCAFRESLQARFNAAGPQEALDAMGRFQILCAIKRGPFGRGAVNDSIERLAEVAGWKRRGAIWYRGRPVLITSNSRQTGLFNGDLGVVWEDEAGAMQVWFPGPEGLRAISPGRLPAHETAFAMTVHKSQGSEFDEVLLVLPPVDSPGCTRELIYTGMTRARRKVVLAAGATVLKDAIGRGGRRGSGLGERLAG